MLQRKACWLILDRRRRKKHYLLINDFNRFMYDHSLYRGRKHFCCYCLHTFITEETLKRHIKIALKIMKNNQLGCLRNVSIINSKFWKKNKKSPFMIYVDLESALVLEDNRKQNPNESYINKYQKHVACSYGYKLVFVDNKFCKPFKSYLSSYTVFNFIAVWSKKVNIVVMWWKNTLTKNLWWLKKIMEIFRTLLDVGCVRMIILIMLLK